MLHLPFHSSPLNFDSPERLDGAVPLRREVEDLRECLGAPRDLRPRHPVQPTEVGQRLQDGELGVERQILKGRDKTLLSQVPVIVT